MLVVVVLKTMFASYYSRFLQSFFPLLFVIFSQTWICSFFWVFLPFFEQQFSSNFFFITCGTTSSFLDSCFLDRFLCSCRFTYRMNVFLLKKNGGYFYFPFEVIKRAFGCKLKKLHLHRLNFGKSSQIYYEYEHQTFGSASLHQS